jgi:hypothetical protein
VGAAQGAMKEAGLLVDLAAIGHWDIAYCAKRVSESQIDGCDVLFPAPD